MKILNNKYIYLMISLATFVVCAYLFRYCAINENGLTSIFYSDTSNEVIRKCDKCINIIDDSSFIINKSKAHNYKFELYMMKTIAQASSGDLAKSRESLVLMASSYMETSPINRNKIVYCLKLCNMAVTQRERPKWLNENTYNDTIKKLVLDNYDNFKNAPTGQP
jgi:hypothetical protein